MEMDHPRIQDQITVLAALAQEYYLLPQYELSTKYYHKILDLAPQAKGLPPGKIANFWREN